MGEQGKEGVNKCRVKHPFVKPKSSVTPVSNPGGSDGPIARKLSFDDTGGEGVGMQAQISRVLAEIPIFPGEAVWFMEFVHKLQQ
jgi:hypothetical protein